MGIVCPRLKEGACSYRHLDTNDPRQLKEFNEQVAVVQSRAAKNKGKSKGKGKGKGKT